MNKLPNNCEEMLVAIAVSEDVQLNTTTMRMLLRFRYISLKLGCGWIVTQKGIAYLEEWAQWRHEITV
jgi:hypothetical protein